MHRRRFLKMLGLLAVTAPVGIAALKLPDAEPELSLAPKPNPLPIYLADFLMVVRDIVLFDPPAPIDVYWDNPELFGPPIEVIATLDNPVPSNLALGKRIRVLNIPYGCDGTLWEGDIHEIRELDNGEVKLRLDNVCQVLGKDPSFLAFS